MTGGGGGMEKDEGVVGVGGGGEESNKGYEECIRQYTCEMDNYWVRCMQIASQSLVMAVATGPLPLPLLLPSPKFPCVVQGFVPFAVATQ